MIHPEEKEKEKRNERSISKNRYTFILENIYFRASYFALSMEKFVLVIELNFKKLDL